MDCKSCHWSHSTQCCCLLQGHDIDCKSLQIQRQSKHTVKYSIVKKKSLFQSVEFNNMHQQLTSIATSYDDVMRCKSINVVVYVYSFHGLFHLYSNKSNTIYVLRFLSPHSFEQQQFFLCLKYISVFAHIINLV